MGATPSLPSPPSSGATPGAGPSLPPRPGALPQPPAPSGPGPTPPASVVCTGVSILSMSCARLLGTVGPPGSTIPSSLPNGKPGPPPNNAADVLMIQKLINVVVKAGYVESAVLSGGNSKLVQPLNENGQWSTQLQNAIKQIELLYFHGRANPHGIAVIDPQADESLFVFLVNLANGSQKAKQQLSVQMKALAVAMIPQSRVKIDAGGTAPDGTQQPAKMEAVDVYLPILLDALTQWNLNDTDMVLVALASVRTETTNFVPISENMYDLNTTGTFTNKATGDTWTDTPADVHSDYKTLQQHYTAALQANPKYPTRGTETFTPNTSGPGGTTIQGDIYDPYINKKGKQVNFNGNTQPGDGWKYRGRGLIQLTGRGRYDEADQKANAGSKFIDDPDLVNTKEYAGTVVAGFLSAVEHKLRQALQNNDLAAARKLVNGGTNGLDTFKIAMAAGRAVIAQAIIQQARATTRAQKTHRPKHSGHRAHPAHPAAPAKPTR